MKKAAVQRTLRLTTSHTVFVSTLASMAAKTALCASLTAVRYIIAQAQG